MLLCPPNHGGCGGGWMWRRERDLNSRGNGPTRFPVARTTRLCDLGSNLRDPPFSFNHHPPKPSRSVRGAKGLKGATSSLYHGRGGRCRGERCNPRDHPSISHGRHDPSISPSWPSADGRSHQYGEKRVDVSLEITQGRMDKKPPHRHRIWLGRLRFRIGLNRTLERRGRKDFRC